jgi:hypothetical protein
MDLLLEQDLEDLLETKGLCVSIYMPTHRSGPEAAQNTIRFKNLLREAGRLLHNRGLLPEVAGVLLEPARALLGDPRFWRKAGDGLAVFLSCEDSREPRADRRFWRYRLPLRFPEQVEVRDGFSIKSLIPLATRRGSFFVLALSQNQVRLIECLDNDVLEVDLDGVPKSITEALGDQKAEEYLQRHTAGGTFPLVHGGGTGAEDVKVELTRYLRQVETGVRERLAGRTEPLVLAGADPLPALYREVNSYPHLLPEAIAGNPEHLSKGELRQLGWQKVRPALMAEQHRAAERYEELAGTHRVSHDIMEVLPAARHGRVDVLFVSKEDDVRGSFDPKIDQVFLDGDSELGDEDLLDTAAALTLRNGGTAYLVNRPQMPGGGEVAAVFRY